MSGSGPESVPVSADPRSKRPTKKRALTPTSAQASQLEGLFSRPDQEIRVPSGPLDPKRRLPLPPEIVTNVQGSSAGAGSGEFHVYKAARRREYERLRIMDEEVRKETEAEEFEKKREEMATKDDEKTRRNREKREKMRLRKERAKAAQKNGGQPNEHAKARGGSGIKARVDGAAKDTRDGVEDVNMDTDAKADEAATTTTNAPGLVIHEDD